MATRRKIRSTYLADRPLVWQSYSSTPGEARQTISSEAPGQVIIWKLVAGFENRVLQTIRRFGMVASGELVTVALSGGPDSVALLLALLKIRRILKCAVAAIHFHHNVRGKEADGDQRFVEVLCSRLRVPLQIGRFPATDQLAGNLENQLRVARYHFFREQLAASRSILATGHTLDDQAETVLLKLVRGAGPRGLAGIYPIRWERSPKQGGFKVVRPLLRSTRAEVLQYLSERKADSRQDSTNLDTSFDRNWVRLQLLPSIENRLNPRAKASLGRTADLHRELVEVMESAADSFLSKHSSWRGRNLRLSHRALLESAPFWRRVYILEAAHRVTLGNELEAAHVSQIEDLLERQVGRRFRGPGSFGVWRERHHLVFSSQAPAAEFEQKLSIPGKIYVKEMGYRLRAWRCPEAESKAPSIRLAFPGSQLTVRNLRSGDRLQIASRGRTRLRKVKDLLVEKNFSSRQRQRLLVLEAEGEILWVEGLGAASDRQVKSFQEPFLGVEVEEMNETLESRWVLE